MNKHGQSVFPLFVSFKPRCYFFNISMAVNAVSLWRALWLSQAANFAQTYGVTVIRPSAQENSSRTNWTGAWAWRGLLDS